MEGKTLELCGGRKDQHKIGILHFAGSSQQRWDGSNVETDYDLIISTKLHAAHRFIWVSQLFPNLPKRVCNFIWLKSQHFNGLNKENETE